MTAPYALWMGESEVFLPLNPTCGWRQCMVQVAEYADGRMVSSVSSSSTGYLTVLLLGSRFKKNPRRCPVPDNDPGVFQPIADTHRVLKPL